MLTKLEEPNTEPHGLSDVHVEGVVMLDRDMREFVEKNKLHVCYSISMWHVKRGHTWLTVGYETPQKALEACWESGEVDLYAEDNETFEVPKNEPTPPKEQGK